MTKPLNCLLAACFFLIFPQSHAHSGKPRNNSLIIAMDTKPLGIIPASTAGIVATMIGTQVFAGLIRPVAGRQDNVEPYLAESWQIGSDNRSITFTIRKNAFFHDNTPITVEDVAFSIESARQYHPYGPAFDLIQRVRIHSPLSLSVEFIHPVPPLLTLFAPNFIPILPRHIYGNGLPLPQRPFDEIPVGSGPFFVNGITDQKIFRLSRFPRFFLGNGPCLSSLEFRVFEDPGDIYFALKAGEIDLVGFSHAPEQNQKLAELADVAIKKTGYYNLGVKAFLYFNMEKEPFTDIRVRKALSYAIDSRFIREHIFRDGAIPLSGPILSSSRFYTPGADVLYPVDIAGANALLDEAGYPRDAGGKRFSVHVDSLPNTRQLFIPMLEYLRHSLSRSVGVELTYTENISLPEWADRVSKGNYQIASDFQFSWSEPIVGTHRNYHSKNIKKGRLWANMLKYKNLEVDALFDKAARTVDSSRRKKIYARIQKLITGDAPSIWIGSIPYVTAFKRKNGQTLKNLDYGLWGLLSPLDHVCWE